MLEAVHPDLVTRAQTGDPTATGELYDHFHLSVFRYLYYRVGDPHSAEDLTSEVFLRVIRSINSYHVQNVAFEAWLFQIARNLAIDHYRKSNGKIHLSLEEDMIAEKDDPARNLDHKLNSDMLVQALAKLTDIQRDVIVMRFINGLPIAQVAQALHRSENAIKALQRRALGALRVILTEWEVTYV